MAAIFISDRAAVLLAVVAALAIWAFVAPESFQSAVDTLMGMVP